MLGKLQSKKAELKSDLQLMEKREKTSWKSIKMLPEKLAVQEPEEKRWGFFFRCKKCGRKTGHAFINVIRIEKNERKETYKCLICGETKKIWVFRYARERSILSVYPNPNASKIPCHIKS